MPVTGTKSDIVGEEMHRFKHGELHSGPDKYGHHAKSRAQAVAIALSVARKHGRSDGGQVAHMQAGGPPWFVKQEARGMLHTGPIQGPVAGRTDHVPLKVPNGSYVLPADFVSHQGQNNTAAGHARISSMFQHAHLAGAPRAKMAGPSPGGSLHMGKEPAGGMPSIFAGGGGIHLPAHMDALRAEYYDGGIANHKAGGVSRHHPDEDDGVPIMGAAGEHVLSPDEVAWVGNGNVEHGHRILDEWVKRVREKHIKTLKGLPGPARD